MTGYVKRIYKDLVLHRLKLNWDKGEFCVGDGMVGLSAEDSVKLADQLYLKYSLVKNG